MPLEVLEKARDELLDWGGSGMSVMEVSHRSKSFVEVATRAEFDLRSLMSIPTNYKVLMDGERRIRITQVTFSATS